MMARGDKALEAMFNRHSLDDFRWIDPKDIVVSQWVRMKCMYGCDLYGKGGCCPPAVPSVAECERFFKEYRQAVIFHFHKRVKRPEDRHAWTRGVNARLLKLERDVFLAGNERAFLLYLDTCELCKECAGSRLACRDKQRARPTADALAVDVYTTVRKAGYHIEVLKDYRQPMDRYAFLLVR